MDRRLLEAFFRHKWLVLLPAILIPLLVVPVAFVTTPPQFESRASVWVDRPTYLRYAERPEILTSPAGEHGGTLAELLRTSSFRADVAKRTHLAPLAENAQGERKLDQYFKKSVFLAPNGDHLLSLRARGGSPEEAQQVAQAVIAAYQERAAADRQQQAQLAVSFYEQRLRTGRNDILADRIRNALENAQYDYAVAQQSQEVAFRVVDAPTLPAERTGVVSKGLVVVTILSLVTGVTLSALVLLALTRMDNSVRTVGELLPVVPVLGSVPVIAGALDEQLRRLINSPTEGTGSWSYKH